jgi:hypothetical protein
MLHNVLVSLALFVVALLITVAAGMWKQETDEVKQWFAKRAAVALLWIGFEFLAILLGWLHSDI